MSPDEVDGGALAVAGAGFGGAIATAAVAADGANVSISIAGVGDAERWLRGLWP